MEHPEHNKLLHVMLVHMYVHIYVDRKTREQNFCCGYSVQIRQGSIFIFERHVVQ